MKYAIAATTLGEVFVAASERGVCRLAFLDAGEPPPIEDAGWVEDTQGLSSILVRIVAHLERGESVEDLPLDLIGTPFQLRVWEALRAIPAGGRLAYGELASRMGLGAGSARAVGTACGANPVALLVPCHRVVPATGGLGGYRWGLERKRALLGVEAARSGAALPLE